jgi:carboxypeptidase C (cathepsin A)
VFRDQGKIGAVYDSNVTSFDPFPYSPDQRSNDPILASMIAPTTTAMVNLVTTTVVIRDQTELTLSPEMAYPCLSNLQSVSPVWSRISRADYA